MAKDDYHVLAYKFLAYLYVQLKAGEDVSAQMISADSPLLGVNSRYWLYIMENLQAEGYIRGLSFEHAWGNEVFVQGLDDCEITPAGIAYLCDNGFLEKVKQFLKDVKEITPFV